ncbi:MAG: aminotransferase class IV, partial [Balneolaceae bacterium]
MTESPSIILNGTLVSEIEAKVSPLNRGMMYGDGCFETLKSYRRKFLEWNLHFQRLSESLEYLGIENDFTNTGLKEEISR